MKWTKEQWEDGDRQAAEYYAKEARKEEKQKAKLCTCALTSYLECPACKNDYKGGI